MRKLPIQGVVGFCLLASAAAIFLKRNAQPENSHLVYANFLNDHPFNQRQISAEQLKEMDKEDRPDLAFEQDFLHTMNPSTHEVDKSILEGARERVRTYKKRMKGKRVPGESASAWEERGPSNVGGRTRALMWDPNDASGKKVWAAGIGGGLWYNNDITDANSSWHNIDDFWSNIGVSAIAYDPTNTNVFYAGTGEITGNTDRINGGQVFKTSDGGATWSELNYNGSTRIADIVVRNENGTGVLYVLGYSSSDLLRSDDGGATFSNVSSGLSSISITSPYNIEIDANNRLWVSGNGDIAYSDDGSTWTKSYSSSNGRVEIACASDGNTIYGLVVASSKVEEIVKTTNGGATWTNLVEPADDESGIPDDDFSRGQAWYDLVVDVSPFDPNHVIVGGVNLFASDDGGASWEKISIWTGAGSKAYSYVHADQHAIQFHPTLQNTVIFGCDGGVFYSGSIQTAASSKAIEERNKNYNVTQFYACAMKPGANEDFYLAGAQDNGTQRFESAGVNSTTKQRGGDGAFCFIDQTDPEYSIASYTYSSYNLYKNGSYRGSIISESSTGSFINQADYDDQLNILYCNGKTSGSSNVVKRVAINNLTGTPSYTPSDLTVSGMSGYPTHLHVSPYTTSSTTLFIGSSAGEIFKMENANGSGYSSTQINGNLSQTGTISCVEIGASENELIATFSNYGRTSVYYTNDGGSTWADIEGDLPDMPVRWALFNPLNRDEVILATEVGVWKCLDIHAASPTWTPSNSGLANTRVDMLQYRASDHQVIAATHGRGLFSGYFSVVPLVSRDAELLNLSLETGVCGSTSIEPKVEIQNNGSDVITSIQLAVKIDNVLQSSNAYNVNIAGGASLKDLSLGSYTLSSFGTKNIEVSVLQVNANTDEESSNDVVSTSYNYENSRVVTFSVTESAANANLTFTFKSGNTLVANQDDATKSTANGYTVYELCIPLGCYDFKVDDAFAKSGTPCTTPAWDAGASYTQGLRCERGGDIYEANWWTQGDDPLTNSDPFMVWTLIGPCSTGTGDNLVGNCKLEDSAAGQLWAESSTNYTDTHTEAICVDVVTGVKDQPKINVRVYPNPATSYLNLECAEGLSQAAYQVLNGHGSMVASGNLGGGANFQLNVTELSPGVYTLVIDEGNQKVYQTRFVKQ